MKILMLNNEFPPIGGGTATVNEELLNQFVEEKNFEIDLITSQGPGLKEQELISSNIKIIRVPSARKEIHHASNFELISYAYQATKAAATLCKEKQYDLCFAWCGVPAGAVAYLLNKRYKIPYLVRVSGPDIPGFEERYSWLYPFLKFPTKKIWKSASALVQKSTIEDKLIKALLPGIKTTLIPNAINSEKFKVEKSSPPQGPLKLLCVGRLVKRKGQGILFEAIKSLKDSGIQILLTLVGDGDESAAYKENVKNLGIDDHVNFAGYIERDRIINFYKDADIFILPSHNEGMCMAALEAAASSLPLLLSYNADNGLVKDKVNGFLFSNSDVSTLCSLIQFFDSNREKIISMGAASRSLVNSFDWRQIANRYSEIFEEIVNR